MVSSLSIKKIGNDLTSGNIFSTLIKYSLPYLLSCFLQTFYGLADLFIIGQFYGSDAISAVSIGSQVMHMITVIFVGLAMGTTVSISRAVGLGDKKAVSANIGNTVTFFLFFSIISTLILIFSSDVVLYLVKTPTEAYSQGKVYCIICFAGIPFITAYNILSSIFRGLGDSKSPTYFVLVAGVLNIALDYIFIGILKMGAGGAAFATVTSQFISVVIALFMLKKKSAEEKEKSSIFPVLSKRDFVIKKSILNQILKIGIPIAFQDGFIQISFLIITAIANSRGVDVAAAVGIVEKIICFLFLVPSAMLSSVSAIAAQNAGAGKDSRGFKTLWLAIMICVIFGTIVSIICNIWPKEIMGIFAKEGQQVIDLGAPYLCSYVTDCIVAGVHFCCSGFFCAYGKSLYSFIHNILSISLIRIPGTYLASIFYKDTLFPMGLAAPLGSFFSGIICIFMFIHLRKKILQASH